MQEEVKKLLGKQVNILFKGKSPLFSGKLNTSRVNDNKYIVNGDDGSGFMFFPSQVTNIEGSNITCKFKMVESNEVK